MGPLQVNIRIAQYVGKVGDPTLCDIKRAMPDVDAETVCDVVQTMCRCGALRMKEDSYEHDWTYRLTAHGRECYSDALPKEDTE